MISHILSESGRPSGLIGTMGYMAGKGLEPGPNTTPEAADVQAILYEMVRAGRTHVAMEASSHGTSSWKGCVGRLGCWGGFVPI